VIHAGVTASVAAAGRRVGAVVAAVCAAAVAQSGATGLVVIDDHTPEGELAFGWLVAALGHDRVWRGAAHTGNVQERVLLAHPANRTALLLGGRLPAADLLPLGDVTASQVEALTGSWTAGPEAESLARDAGGIASIDAALRRLVDERRPAVDALAELPGEIAARLLDLYDRGRWFRLRPPLTPKLTVRTLGIDLFD
jgi:hypothetical protein